MKLLSNKRILIYIAVFATLILCASCSDKQPPNKSSAPRTTDVKSVQRVEQNLYLAASNGDLFSVRALIKAKADVNTREATGESGATPLMIASEEGHLDVVQSLIAAGADVNAKGYILPDLGGNQTALMLASWRGHTNVVKALIDAKADVNLKSSAMTALMAALDYPDIVKLLIEAGANKRVKINQGETAFIMAARNSYDKSVVESMKLLLDSSIDQKDKNTALLYTARFSCDSEIIKLLLQAGAEKNTKDHYNFYTVGRFIAPEDNINHATPLIWAAYSGNIMAVKVLLDAGANKHAEDYWHHTAFWWAKKNYYNESELCRLLDTGV